MDYNEAIVFLEHLQSGRIRAQLESMAAIADSTGNSHRKFQAIHIAGTNGKGSVAAIAESILRAHGYKTGLYTSPHIIDFSERIRVQGVPIAHHAVVDLLRDLIPPIRRFNCTYFEAATLLAFHYFAGNGVDIAVIETGLGGRWDATNIITPLVSVITHIALDHQDYLGQTIMQIAREKAGILKQNVPCVISAQEDTIADYLLGYAKQVGAPAVMLGKQARIIKRDASINGMTFDFEFNGEQHRQLFVPLAGSHQLENSGAGLAALLLLKRNGYPINTQGIAAGLASCKWEGRFEKIMDDPPFIVDVAHNPDAFSALKRTVEDIYPGRKIILIFGVFKDKAYREMISIIKPVCKAVIGIPLPGERSISVSAMRDIFTGETFLYEYCEAIHDVPFLLKKIVETGDIIIAAGSHFTVGAIKSIAGHIEEILKKS